MLQFAGVNRLLWNVALDQRSNHYRNYRRVTGDTINYVNQARELTVFRREVDFVRAVSQTTQQNTLKALDVAFQRFFKGTGGYPKFKKAGRNDSFEFAGREVAIEKLNAKWSRVKLPKIGWVKFKKTRNVEGKITSATVARTAIGWQISFSTKIDRVIADVGGAVGIDRGVAIPLMLSGGVGFNLPASVDALDVKARKAQRIASRRKRSSARHEKAQRRVVAIKAKQSRARKDWAHKATTQITRQYGTVVVERLRTKNMTASAKGTIDAPGKNVAQKRGLNRAILNVGWHQIETMLAYKAFELIKVNPAYTSQTCSSCDVVDSRGRKSQASFVCPSCGFALNADHNAAINIRNRGNTAVLDVEGVHSIAPFEASTGFAA